MADPVQLANFREARDSIRNVRQLASEIDGSIGRFQIYDDPDAISDAFCKMDALILETRALQTRIISCRNESAENRE
jgi:hypothetical protein